MANKKPHKMAREQRSAIWWIALGIALVAGGVAAYFFQPQPRVYTLPVIEEPPQWKAGAEDVDAFADTMTARAKATLIGLGVPREVIRVARLPESEIDTSRWAIRADVPGVLPLSVCNLSLTRLAHQLGGAVLDGSEDRSGETLSLLVGIDGEQTHVIALEHDGELERTAGRIAIVIDGFGYQDQALIQGFCDLPQPIAFSIFPGERHTAWTAQQATEKNHGVMVHLPMEPIGYPEHKPGPDAIFADDAPEKIAALTQNALSAVPHARGMNNHLGSRVTQNADAMKVVLQIVKQRDFFFLDGMTSPRSLAYTIAREMGIRSGRSAMFFDLADSEGAIAKRLYALAARARQEGAAIGIGHAKRETLTALQRVLPELTERGFTFVLAEEIAE